MILFSYILYYLIIIPISWLPFPVLYLLSDFFCFILYYIIPYRKKVVFTNLRNSFPEKKEKEIEEIAKKFYQHLCDIIFESLKTFTISEEEVKKRMKFINPEILDPYYQQKKSIIAITGHYANWEWVVVTCQLYTKHKAFGIYLPLSNEFFEKKVGKSRMSFGMTLVSMRDIKAYFEKYKNDVTLTGIIVDQSPSNARRCHWMQFLNQDTPVFLGTEKYSALYDYPVFFGKTKKIKRGYYELELMLISDHPRQEKEFYITERHTKFLEKQIIETPEYWLWTHKRWKHKRSSYRASQELLYSRLTASTP